MRQLIEKLPPKYDRLSVYHEARPCGYGLHQQVIEFGHECMVVATSFIPVCRGDHVKTDRRDALPLARLHRADEFTAVRGPEATHEAMRDLAPSLYNTLAGVMSP